jgi:hypothetical protein
MILRANKTTTIARSTIAASQRRVRLPRMPVGSGAPHLGHVLGSMRTRVLQNEHAAIILLPRIQIGVARLD